MILVPLNAWIISQRGDVVYVWFMVKLRPETCERGAANYLSDKHQQFFKSNQAQAVNSPFTDYVSLKITWGCWQTFNKTKKILIFPASCWPTWWRWLIKSCFRTALLILDHCDYKISLDHGDKLGSEWRCANKTEVAPGHECSNIFNTCHTLLDLTGPLQLGALPGEEIFD